MGGPGLCLGEVRPSLEECTTGVEVDEDAVRAMGLRIRASDLLSEDGQAGVRHDPRRLAREVCAAALVRL